MSMTSITKSRSVDVLLVIAAVVLALAYAPMLAALFTQLWGQPHTQFFPFVIAAVIGLTAMRWRETKDVDSNDQSWKFPWYGWVLAIVAWLLMAAGIAIYAPWLGVASLIALLGAVAGTIAQKQRVTYLWGIWALLWLILPLPMGQDQRLIVYLQGISSSLSSSLLDAIGVRHLMEGNALTLANGGKQLFVDEACSGIVSVMSIVACGAIYAVWKNRPPLHALLLAGMGVFWALVMNVVRISTIAVALDWWGVDWTEGFAHQVISLAVFLAAFVALVSTDHLLQGMLAPIAPNYGRQVGGNLPFGKWLVAASDWLTSWGDPLKGASMENAVAATAPTGPVSRRRSGLIWTAMIAFGSLGIVQLAWLPTADTAAAKASIDRALAIKEQDMPEWIGSWQRVSFESQEREVYSDFGRYSKNYMYRQRDTGEEVSLSLDFPYRGGWHDLCVCYRNTGWTIEDRVVANQLPAAEANWPYVDGLLTSPTRGEARILFAGFDVAGDPATPPTDAVLYRPWFKLRREMLMNLAPQLFQVQVFQSRIAGAKATDDASLQQLLEAARGRFRDLVAENSAPATSDKSL